MQGVDRAATHCRGRCRAVHAVVFGAVRQSSTGEGRGKLRRVTVEDSVRVVQGIWECSCVRVLRVTRDKRGCGRPCAHRGSASLVFGGRWREAHAERERSKRERDGLLQEIICRLASRSSVKSGVSAIAQAGPSGTGHHVQSSRMSSKWLDVYYPI